LFRREGESRILMFGGGFGRQALIDLCESALRQCGGRD
jgi:UDP-N-acetylglucosamine:LPS N-acetylglucosamine transferase